MIRIDFKSGYYSSQMVDCTIFVGSRKYSDARVVDIHVRYLYSYQKDEQTHSEDLQLLVI